MTKKECNILISKWQDFFISRGLTEDLRNICIEYITPLIQNNLPPIFDFKHLCQLLGIKESILASMVNCPEKYYHTFTIPKKSGGKRTITAPYPSLKLVQTWIYQNILDKIEVHGCAHGFIKKRSILTNVKVHQDQKCLLKIDLKDFFPSIPLAWIINIFKSLGYEHYVAFYLASLCCCEGVLPQGSPASPVLSNIVAKRLDKRLYRLAKRYDLNYSRYADDIAFSGEHIPVKFIEYINTIITNYHLSINPKKVRLYKEHGNKILTGISLSTGKPKLPRDYRRTLEKELYFIKKYGLEGHINHNKIRKTNYLESILGKVGYWVMIEPDNQFAKEMQTILNQEYKKKLGCIVDDKCEKGCENK